MKHILLSLFFLFTTYSCHNGTTIKEYTISTQSDILSDSKIIFSKEDNCYLYDLKITDNFYLFLDEKSDTVLRVYKKNNLLQTHSLCRSSEKGKLWMPLFTKETHEESEKTDKTFLVDNNIYYKDLELHTNNNNIDINILKLLKQQNMFSRDFNITTKETYAIPISRDNKNPFYFFNPDSGYYWVDPSPSIEKMMPKDVLSYTNTICLNENQNMIVSAYRFTNYISFYTLDGALKTTVKFGKESISPVLSHEQDKIDIRNTPKCFTYICGTPQYVYCLYDGSSDFTNPSKIVVFQWNGKHVKTWKLNRNIRAIAVDKKDKYILAIASNNNGQDIIKYNLE
ncbi:hypothetical protein [Parabacteroides goldsteinii]|uniref:Uncharacterized protein n=1 Tax=Parabacteroides goldsteinii DSM 19448 = WAL 12034 TaxID=927665 RepID=A0A0F5J6P3_9BACT|nr:hypothetical protein [Parabacteroides goldsteinii]KKB53438.1 hypothetical protein HMPREF1535_02979 [Parabacteroides goldsteinii DSM 19448 = WAL 12034]